VPFGVEMPDVKILPTVEEAIGDLADLPLGWGEQEFDTFGYNDYVDHLASPWCVIDGHMTHSDTSIRRIEYLLNTVDWYEGEAQSDAVRRCWQEGKELPDVWQRRIEHHVERDFFGGFNQPHRLRRDHTAPVCTGAALGTLIHYSEPRTITFREEARLMGFPDEWSLAGLERQKGAPAYMGKGVTVHVGEWIGYWMRQSLEGNPGSMVGNDAGERESVINITNEYKKMLTSVA
jgi:site-specific DNA-cytosine methylase